MAWEQLNVDRSPRITSDINGQQTPSSAASSSAPGKVADEVGGTLNYAVSLGHVPAPPAHPTNLPKKTMSLGALSADDPNPAVEGLSKSVNSDRPRGARTILVPAYSTGGKILAAVGYLPSVVWAVVILPFWLITAWVGTGEYVVRTLSGKKDRIALKDELIVAPAAAWLGEVALSPVRKLNSILFRYKAVDAES